MDTHTKISSSILPISEEVRAYLCFVLLFVMTLHLNAQDPFNQFYEMDNIHSKELIKGVMRDRDGYLWVATDDGILMYDGLEMKVYNQLNNRYAKEFLQTKKDEVYVIHDSGIDVLLNQGDSIYSRAIQNVTSEFSINYPKSIYEARDSVIWIGETDAIVRLKNNQLKRYSLGEEFHSISYHHSFAFAEDAFGHIWVAPFKGPLLYYDEERDEFVRVKMDSNLTEVSAIASIKGDYLIVSGKEGIILLKIDSKKDILEIQPVNGVLNISDIEVVGNSYVYLSTWDNGMYRWDFDEGLDFIHKIKEVTINDIVGLSYNQPTQEIWIAGGESIGVLKRTQVNAIEKTGSSRIESLTFSSDQSFYFSTGESVFYLDGKNEDDQMRILYSSDTFFGRILYDDGLLWIGDFFGKVYYHDFKSAKFTYVVDELGTGITYITKDSKANKWFAGNNHGLIKVNDKKALKVYPEISSSVIVRESKDGTLMCAGGNQNEMLYLYDEDKDGFLPIDLNFDSVHFNVFSVNDFDFDLKENIWIATSNGLLFVEKNTSGYSHIRKVSVAGYENEAIRSIAISENFIWLGYPEGLLLYNPDESLLFNKDSGLPSSILKERGLKYGPDGKLYIYTAKGLATINETNVEFKKSKKPLFKSIHVNGESINFNSSERLAFPNNSRLTCDFLTLAFPNTKLQYQTRVIGYEDEWSLPTANTSLSILGFSEGEYTVEIRAKKGGFLWSEPTSFSFIVAKPWYREWWSILLFLVFAGLVVVLFVQIHNRNLIRQKRRLQEIIEQRTNEIQSQKNEIIEQQERLIAQKEELLQKNQLVHNSEQAKDKAELNFLHLKEKQLEEQIEYKNKQITTHALNILQKNETLKELREEINSILKKPEKSTIVELKRTLKVIDGSFKLDKDWDDFKLYFEQIYTGFYAKLKVNFPEITNLEMRHCALIRLNLPIAECASILGISHDSVKVTRSRLRKKLGLPPNQGLTEFIMSL